MGLLLVSVCSFLSYYIAKLVYKEYMSPHHLLPGPPSKSLFLGNLPQILSPDSSTILEEWIQKYGPTIRYRGLFGQSRFYTADVKAIQHVLMNIYEYPKPEVTRLVQADIFGEGLFTSEGEKHKFQRRVMTQNPAFGPAQIRDLMPVFLDKAFELTESLKSQIANNNGIARIEVLDWLNRTTLDVIGLAGFHFQFNALAAEETELNQAFNIISSQSSKFRFWPLFRAHFPSLRIFPVFESKEVETARRTMNRIGLKLLEESKTTAAFDKSSVAGRDLLSLLVKSNMTESGDQEMSDEDVLAQISTFLMAGHETTSTATAWALYALTQYPGICQKLRDELLQVPTDTPTMDQLNELPYLDAFVRETLRLHPPTQFTTRQAKQDGVLPLSEPVNGVDHIQVRKGQTVFISIQVLNRSKKLWGEDATEFKPGRWLNGSIETGLPGVWGSMLSFIGGPRSCIGFRFAITEMKTLLFALVRSFELELAVPADDLGKKTTLTVLRPFVKSEEKKGSQLPLSIKLYHPERS